MQQFKSESFVDRLILGLRSLPLGFALMLVAAGCTFAPTGDAGRDQARVIAAGKNADVAEEAEEAEEAREAQDEKDAEEHENAGAD
jgi:hypothetical protein